MGGGAWVLPGYISCGCNLLTPLTGYKEENTALMAPRVKPTPSLFPTYTVYETPHQTSDSRIPLPTNQIGNFERVQQATVD